MPAEIRQGTVVYDGQVKGIDVSETRDGIVADFHCSSFYEKDMSTYAGALTSPDGWQGDDVAVVTLGRPVLLWFVDWTVMKAGGEPPVPHPDPPAGWRLLDVTASPAMLGVAPDGETPLYRISGVYTYVKLKSSANVYSDVTFPLAPWVSKSAFKRKLSLSRLEGYIAGTGSGSGRYGGTVGFLTSRETSSKFTNAG